MEWEVTWNGWVDWGDGNSHAACTYNSVTCVRRGGDMGSTWVRWGGSAHSHAACVN